MSRISRRTLIGEYLMCIMVKLNGRAILMDVYSLIEKDYMERDEGNTYSYIA